MKNSTYFLEQSPLYRIPTLNAIGKLLSPEAPNLLTHVEEQLRGTPRSYYKVWTKKGREIQEPRDHLKRIQRRIFALLSRIKLPEYLYSARKGRSYIDNAEAHVQAGDYALSLDIRKFYASSKRNFVLRFFLHRLQTASDIANLLANLCCYSFEKIPTGSSVSQILAFWAYEPMFDELQELATKHGAKLSIYVDDLSFSSLSPIPATFHLEVQKILNSYQLRINWKKISYSPASQPKEITGCVITADHRLTAPSKLKIKAIKAIHEFKSSRKASAKVGRTALGLINSLRQIEPGTFEQSKIQVQKKLKHLQISNRKTG